MKSQSEQSLDVSVCMDQFDERWRRGDMPHIDEFVALAEPSRRRDVLIELVMLDLEHRYRYAAKREPVDPIASTQGGSASSIRRRLEDYVARYPELGSLESLPIDLILEEYRVRHNWHDAPAAEEYAFRFPWLGAQLAVGIKRIDAEIAAEGGRAISTGGVGSTNRGDSSVNGPSATLATNGQLGDYTILEELGRGGMGVVYRAIQRTANREVALKLIRSDRLGTDTNGDDMIKRFRTEALAAARLIHDHVVTVYDIGSVDGRHFYSMRFVNGKSLSELLRQGPLEGQHAARYIEGVARAAHHAHGKGVLHRDFKPQNVLIEEETDRALVTDFGLAKLVDGKSPLTLSGEVFGSPPYMSPEQTVDAGRVTAASDVYGIGATLYHAIVGRPPIQAATIAETIRQVQETDPVRPRQLNPVIDADLETICMKCLEKNPTQRYADAEQLAEDLHRYLRHLPIVARPIGVVGRLRRWSRRRPLVAALTSALLVCVLAGSAAVLWQWRRAEQNRAEAQENFQFSRVAVKDLFVEVSQNDLLNEPGVQPVRRKLLQRALDYYRVFADRYVSDENSRSDLAEAYLNIASINEEIGSAEQAMEFYDRAVAAYAPLVEQNPEDEIRRSAFATALFSKGRVHERVGESSKAGDALKRALEQQTELTIRFPDGWEHRLAESKTHALMADVYRKTSQLDLARTHVRQAASALQMVPVDIEAARIQGLEAASELAEWAGDFKQAIQARTTLLANRPQSMRHKHALARLHHFQGLSVRDKSRQSAIRSFEEAITLNEPLAAANPRVTEFQQQLAESYDQLAFTLASQGQTDQAFQRYEQARAISKELVKSDPSDVRKRNFLATIHNGLGLVCRDRKDFATALTWFQKALQIQNKLVTEFPEVVQLRRDRAGTYRNIGRTHERAGQLAQAVETYSQSLALHDGWENRDSRDAQDKLETWQSLVNTLLAVGDQEQAETAIRESARFCREWLAKEPKSNEFRLTLAALLTVHAQQHVKAGRYQDCISVSQEAATLYQSVRNEDSVSASRFLSEVVVLYNNLGVAYLRMGENDAAATAYEGAIDALTSIRTATGKCDQSLLLQSYASLGALKLKAHDYLSAVSAFEAALEISDDPRIRISRASAQAAIGRHADAIATANQFYDSHDKHLLYAAAGIYAISAQHLAQDVSLSEESRRAVRDEYVSKGVEFLRKASLAGFFLDSAQRELLMTDPDLEGFRGHIVFDEFLNSLRR